ncbi:MAG TPA: carotenoid oxygenase family protein [Streptosporangiaceae bacterium]|jgi:carotenoid cleavage dioxygenase
MTENATRPLYLDGHMAPVPDEIEAFDLEVTGALPAELTGRYLRNGPNPLPGEDSGHWFTGHGMLHGVRLRDGRAEWYRNRWVRTRELAGDPYVSPEGVLDLAANPANTHVIRQGERILALCEAGLPYEVTPELATVGAVDFAGRLTTAMTAHPKEDPVTGDLHFFGYSPFPPYLTYHRLTAAGELAESYEVAVPGPTMMHDFAITEHNAVWLDLPMVFDLALGGAGLPYRWDDDYGARVGVMPHTGPRAGQVTWFDVDPAYVFHVGNAHEDAEGRVVLDAMRYTRDAINGIWSSIGGTPDPVADAAANLGARLHRWTLDPASGRRTEAPLDDRDAEFPTLNDARIGRASRYLYAVTGGAILKYDTGGDGLSATEYAIGEHRDPGEAVFVPAADARAEDEGWLLSIAGNGDGGSDLLVLDAKDLTFQAAVHLPRRVPSGFHGNWMADPVSG